MKEVIRYILADLKYWWGGEAQGFAQLDNYIEARKGE